MRPACLAAPLALAALTACSPDAPANPPSTPPSTAPSRPAPPETPTMKIDTPEAQADAKAVVAGNTRFALDVLSKLGDGDDNVAFSPLSLSVALAMTHAGAEGATAGEMAKALHIGTIGSPRADAAWGAALSAMRASIKRYGERASVLSVANRVWADESLPVREAYSALLAACYQSAMGRANFGSRDETAAAINAWVKEQTHGLIPQIVRPDHIQPLGMVLTNTVYFKGRWDEVFYDGGTRPQDFTLQSGRVVQAPMMRQTDHFAYAEGTLAGQRVQAVSLPYEGGCHALVILPEKADGARTLAKALAAGGDADLDRLTQSGKRREVILEMPKFTVETKASVAEVLQDLGVKTAFTDAATFPKISSEIDLKIADVLHACKIIVDEEGTEAAAATAVVMAPTSAAPGHEDEPVKMTVNRPFLFVIRESQTGAWLFVSKIEDPRADR